MPLVARWRPLRTLPTRRGRDAMPGAYELADGERRLIYIGQSTKDVPNRIRQHLGRSTCIRERARYWRYLYSKVPQAEEALQLERHLKHHGKLPLCNRARPGSRGGRRRYAERSGGT